MMGIFTWIDVGMTAVFIISISVSLIRGFFKELISLLTWLVGVTVALRYAPVMAIHFQEVIHASVVRFCISFAAIFFVIWLVGAGLGFLFSHLINKTGLSWIDRLIGVVFGAARGVLLIAVFILFAQLTAIVHQRAWQDSKIIPIFHPVAEQLSEHLPNYMKRLDSYHDDLFSAEF